MWLCQNNDVITVIAEVIIKFLKGMCEIKEKLCKL